MKSNLNLPLKQMTKEYLANIKVICFDCDGVTKEKGTDFIMEKGSVVLKSHSPTPEILAKLKKLSKHYHVTFSSGRAMDYLVEMYGEAVKENGSLQAEIGMYMWFEEQVTQNFKLTTGQVNKIEKIRKVLMAMSDNRIKGFEPKKYLITMHCKEAMPEIKDVVGVNDPEGELYCWWNEEAYDVGLKTINKGSGLTKLVEKLGLEMRNVMTVGNGINDTNMRDVVGLDISTDQKHLSADFVAWGEHLGGEDVVDRVLELVENG
jgi:hydroxymethylpyrimidine pyrophosphatase-like HAD family hydrolase